MSRLDDDRSQEGVSRRRLYVRPRPGESDEDFTKRFRDGVLAMIAEYREEHPEYFEDDTTANSPVETDNPRRRALCPHEVSGT